MRISDDRYSRDQRRLQLGWRMIQHNARTATIAHWTRLSRYRVIRLRRHYATTPAPSCILKGSAPFRVEFFLRTERVRCETVVLSAFFGVSALFSSELVSAPEKFWTL